MMSTLVHRRGPVEDSDLDHPVTIDDVRRTIRQVVGHVAPHRMLIERRHDRRFAFIMPVELTPVDAYGHPDPDRSMVVMGRNLSERGFDFYHTAPLPERNVIVWLPISNTEVVGLTMELTWCRYHRLGWYANGGRFVRVESIESDGGELPPS